MEVKEQKERLDRWYWAMKYEGKEDADLQKRNIDARLEEFSNPEMKSLYELLVIRYHLMYKDFENAASAFAETGPVEDENHWLNYFYYFFRGIYHYDRKEYRAAIDNYMKAKPLALEITMIELAELYYKLASAYLRTYETALSIEFTKKALEIFKERSHYIRMADCNNLIGINLKDIKQYKEAEHFYHDAVIHATKADDEPLKMRIFHNFGVLYTEQNDPKTAISYLQKVNQCLDKQDEHLKVQNLYLLARNYFKTDQVEKARNHLSEGIILSSGHEDQEYYYHCKLLEAKFLKPDRFESVYIEGIAYYQNHELWEFVYEYGQELASYYRGSEFYQVACEYYDLAINARNNIEKERALSHV
ncbi:MAG TPA: hypothetical protein VF199_00700 [Bacillales bacterium]